MKHFLSIIMIILIIFIAAPARAADVGVSVSIGQPGFYGRINIGNFYEPVVIYPQPILVRSVYVVPQPIYRHVPAGHVKHWRYNDAYVPYHQARGERWVYGR